MDNIARHPAMLQEAEAMIAGGEAIRAMGRRLDPLIAWHEARYSAATVSLRSPAHWRLFVDRCAETRRPLPPLAGPAWVLALYLTGQALLALDEPAAARQAFAAAVARSPVDAHSLAEIGRIDLLAGDFHGARAAFDSAATLAEALAGGGEARLLAHALKGRGQALAALGDGAAARRDFDRALAVDPLDWQARTASLRLAALPRAA